MYKRIIKYINHFLTSNKRIKTGSAHQEIQYLINEVIQDFTTYYCFSEIEHQRQVLLENSHTISITDFGAGSKVHKSNNRKISSIAKYSLKPKKQVQLLFRLVNYFNPDTILEIGSSLGITSSYLAKVNSQSNVFCLEGCPEQIKIANKIHEKLKIKNISIFQVIFLIRYQRF